MSAKTRARKRDGDGLSEIERQLEQNQKKLRKSGTEMERTPTHNAV